MSDLSEVHSVSQSHKFCVLFFHLECLTDLSGVHLANMSCNCEGLTNGRSRNNWTLEGFKFGMKFFLASLYFFNFREPGTLLQMRATTLRCSSSLRSPSLWDDGLEKDLSTYFCFYVRTHEIIIYILWQARFEPVSYFQKWTWANRKSAQVIQTSRSA